MFLFVAACFLRIKYQQDKNSGILVFQKMLCLHENGVCIVLFHSPIKNLNVIAGWERLLEFLSLDSVC